MKKLQKEYFSVLRTLNKSFENRKIKIQLYRELWDRETQLYVEKFIKESCRCN